MRYVRAFIFVGILVWLGGVFRPAVALQASISQSDNASDSLLYLIDNALSRSDYDVAEIKGVLDSLKQLGKQQGQLEWLIEAYQWEFEYLQRQQQWRAAFQAQDSLLYWRDSLHQRNLNVAEDESLEVLNREAQISALREENYVAEMRIKQRRLMIYTLVTGMVLLIILLALLVFRNRNTRKTYAILERRNQDYQERNQELQLQREKLEASEQALKEVNRSKDQFFSMVAKDLRYPLTSLSSYLSVMLKEASNLSSEDLNVLARKIDGSVRHLWHLIDNLLFWSRQQMRSVETNPQTFPIERVLHDVITHSQSIADEKGIVIEVDVPSELVGQGVLADKGHAEFIVRNLISNAIKFSTHKGSITAGVRDAKEMIEVFVEDRGVGINEEEMATLWTGETGRTNAQRRAMKGTGLGLVLTKALVELNGGNIFVESEPNLGAVFSFTLPHAHVKM